MQLTSQELLGAICRQFLFTPFTADQITGKYHQCPQVLLDRLVRTEFLVVKENEGKKVYQLNEHAPGSEEVDFRPFIERSKSRIPKTELV